MIDKKISIIVPVYNVEKYIEKCIKSILAQENCNMEIIIVNDGSTDSSLKICNRISKYDNRIKIITQNNGGLSAARNTGLKYANGDYCYFIDGDDYLENNILEEIIDEIEEKSADCIVFGYRKVTENGKELIRLNLEEHNYMLQNNENYKEFIFGQYLSGKLAFAVWNKIYSMNIIKNNNLKFQPNKKIFAEDVCFNLIYFMFCRKIIIRKIISYNYLQRKDSIMQRTTEIKFTEFVNLYRVVQNQYQEKNFLTENIPCILLGLLVRDFWAYGAIDFFKEVIKYDKKEFIADQILEIKKSDIKLSKLFQGYLVNSICILENMLYSYFINEKGKLVIWIIINFYNRIYRIIYRGTEKVRKVYW